MNFYNPESIHPENQLNPDILPERDETCPFPASMDQLHAPHGQTKILKQNFM